MTERRIAIILEADGKASVAAFDETTGAVTRLDDATDKLNANATQSGGAAEKLGKRWAEAGKVIGQGIGALVAGAALLIGTQINVADSTDEMAQRIGVSTEFISEMGYATKMAAGDSSFLEASLARLAVNAAKAEQGAKGPSAAFRSLGIDVKDADGKLKSLERLLPEVADKFQAMRDGPREAGVAVALFSREGRKMLPVLNQGSEGIAALREEAARLGITIRGDTAEAAGLFNDNLDRVRASVQGLTNSIMADALPALVTLSGDMATNGQQAAAAGGQYSAVGLILKALGSVYYIVAGIVQGATTLIAASMQTVQTMVTTAGRNIGLFFAGISTAADRLRRGDLIGAFQGFTGAIGEAAGNSRLAIRDIGIGWTVAGQTTSDAIGGIGSKLYTLWNPAMTDAANTARDATGASDDLGDGFLGAGKKAADGADKAAKAMQRLRELVRDQQNETLSEVGQAENDYTGVKEKIDLLERETAALGPLVERQQLLEQARNAAAAAHAKALSIAKFADAEREREKDVVGRVLDDYREEATLIGLSSREREIQTLMLKAETKAREINGKHMRDSAGLTAEEAASLRTLADGYIRARDAAEGLRDIRESQKDEIETLRATVKSGGELTAALKAEVQIRKLLLGLSTDQVKARQSEIDLIRQQAREIDTLNAQQSIQNTVRDMFSGVIDGQQQGRSPWESFRNEGVRALTQIGREFAKVIKSTGSWDKALKTTGQALKEVLPELGQLAGTLAGGGGEGAALGAAIGGAIGSYFGPIGTVIGSLIGGWAGGTFDDDPSIRVGTTVAKPEQTRTSRFQTFQVRTESMTDPTSSAVADAIVEFDSLIYDMLTTAQRATVRAGLQNFTADAPVLTEVLKQRMNVVLGSVDKIIGDFVRGSSTDLQRQMQNLNEVLTLQQLEVDGDLLTGTLSRALQLIEAFGRAGESAGQTYQRLGQIAMNYGTSMTDINRQVIMSGLNDYQRSQVEIELQYRSQIKQANELAKAMGLSGARAEDLAKIEELRAINMAEVQRQIEAERARMLADLDLSDLSPLRDEQKLGEAMRELRNAVSSGDMSRAQELAQSALGFGRNLFASGADYNALYGEVRGLLGQVNESGTKPLSETQLDTIADLLTDLPEQIARSMFDLLYSSAIAAGTIKPVITPKSGNGQPLPDADGSGNRAGNLNNAQLEQIIRRLESIEKSTASTADTSATVARSATRRELAGIGDDR